MYDPIICLERISSAIHGKGDLLFVLVVSHFLAPQLGDFPFMLGGGIRRLTCQSILLHRQCVKTLFIKMSKRQKLQALLEVIDQKKARLEAAYAFRRSEIETREAELEVINEKLETLDKESKQLEANLVKAEAAAACDNSAVDEGAEG